MFINDIRSLVLAPVVDSFSKGTLSDGDVPVAIYTEFERSIRFGSVSELKIQLSIRVVLDIIGIKRPSASQTHPGLPD
jgi:hypothetical protein